MTESWVIMDVSTKAFFRFPPPQILKNVTFTTSWTIHINKARVFPSEAAALAVRSEWGLENKTRVAVICPSED